jgi:hypothetical protein
MQSAELCPVLGLNWQIDRAQPRGLAKSTTNSESRNRSQSILFVAARSGNRAPTLPSRQIGSLWR